jgi:two-component system CheB/CheR fusion protein
MQVRKFTLAASKFIKLQSGDIGRHITDFATHITAPKLYEKIEEVIAGSAPFSENIAPKGGLRVLIRVMPYMSNKKIKGAIVNFIELNEGDPRK